MKIKELIPQLNSENFVIITPIIKNSITRETYKYHRYIDNYYVKYFTKDHADNMYIILAKKHRLGRK